MQITPITDKARWETFVQSYHPNYLLQSWNYGEFAKKQGRRVFRLGIYEDDNLIGVAQFNKIASRRGHYLECHGGPLIDWQNPQNFANVLDYLEKLAREEKCHFLRLRPPLYFDPKHLEYFLKQGFLQAPMYFPAEHTLHLDLTQDQDRLLAGMRKNTRYAIGRAQREGVKIKQFSRNLNPKGLDWALQSFFKLYQKTVKRGRFVPYDYPYFNNQLASFLLDDQAAIFLAEWQKRVVTSAIVFFYADCAYYLHGASIPTSPDVFASYTVQWAAILEAKKRGCQIYDFWGVAPEGSKKNHPRAGVTFFKEGFGGQRVRWMTTLDLPLSWRYWLTYGFVKWERWRKGL